MAVAAQYVFKANPGVGIEDVIAVTKDGAALWRKHGAEVSFWAVGIGEVGNFVFVARFESFSAYGTTLDALNADPAFQAWRAGYMKSNQMSWVRVNVSREIPV